MQDASGSVGYWYWKELEWAVPTEIRELVCEIDVSLTVKISYPDPKSEMDSWNNRACKKRGEDPRGEAWY